MTICWCAVERDPSFRPPLSCVCSRRLFTKWLAELAAQCSERVPISRRGTSLSIKLMRTGVPDLAAIGLWRHLMYFSSGPIPGSPN